MRRDIRPRIVSFAQYSESVGAGHLVRQQALQSSLRKDAQRVTLVEFSEVLDKRVVATWLACSDVAIFDAASGIESGLALATDHEVLTVALDWFGLDRPDVAFTIFPHGRTDGRLHSFVGPEWIVLRPEVLSEMAKPMRPLRFDVLVCLGAGDKNRQTHSLSAALGARGIKVGGVFGPLATLPRRASHYRILANPTGLQQLMRQSAVVVTNGGTCLFESLALGVPCLAIAQTPAEMAIIEWLDIPQLDPSGMDFEGRHGFTVNTSTRADHTDPFQFIDGKGAHRLAEEVLRIWRQVVW